MVSIDLERLRRRLRLKYEWGRSWRALLGFAPSLIVVVVAALVAPNPIATAGFGVAMFLWGAMLLWYGRGLKHAVLPGLAAGLVPLTLVICANRLEHMCLGGSCMAVCIPACVVGGLAAGLAVAAVGRAGGHGARFGLSASVVALLTGAMGCVCIGASGLAGLVVGYLAGTAPAILQTVFVRR